MIAIWEESAALAAALASQMAIMIGWWWDPSVPPVTVRPAPRQFKQRYLARLGRPDDGGRG